MLFQLCLTEEHVKLNGFQKGGKYELPLLHDKTYSVHNCKKVKEEWVNEITKNRNSLNLMSPDIVFGIPNTSIRVGYVKHSSRKVRDGGNFFVTVGDKGVALISRSYTDICGKRVTEYTWLFRNEVTYICKRFETVCGILSPRELSYKQSKELLNKMEAMSS